MATTKKKTIVTPGTKVSQKTIDDIKRLGMTKALALAGKNGKTAGGLASEFQEGVRRMYGAKRLETAMKSAAGTSGKSPYPFSGAAGKTKTGTKPAPKSGSSMGDKAKVVGGTAAAIGLLALTKGKGMGTIAKLSPAIGGLAKSSVGKAIFGTGEKISTKAFSTTGRVAAKAGKPVSQAQLDAMKATAKAKGIKLPAATKAATKPKPGAAKTTATKPLPKLTKTQAFAASSGGNQKTTTKKKTTKK
jgi:hypothetical protein